MAGRSTVFGRGVMLGERYGKAGGQSLLGWTLNGRTWPKSEARAGVCDGGSSEGGDKDESGGNKCHNGARMGTSRAMRRAGDGGGEVWVVSGTGMEAAYVHHTRSRNDLTVRRTGQRGACQFAAALHSALIGGN